MLIALVGDSEGRGRGAGRAHQATESAPPNGWGVSRAYTCSELSGQEDVSKLQGPLCQLAGTAAWHPRLAHSFPVTLLGAVARGGGKGEAFVR